MSQNVVDKTLYQGALVKLTEKRNTTSNIDDGYFGFGIYFLQNYIQNT